MVFYTEDKGPGYVFHAVAFTIIISAFIALIRFQNNYRAKGVIGRAEATGQDEVLDDVARNRQEEPNSAVEPERISIKTVGLSSTS